MQRAYVLRNNISKCNKIWRTMSREMIRAWQLDARSDPALHVTSVVDRAAYLLIVYQGKKSYHHNFHSSCNKTSLTRIRRLLWSRFYQVVYFIVAIAIVVSQIAIELIINHIKTDITVSLKITKLFKTLTWISYF